MSTYFGHTYWGGYTAPKKAAAAPAVPQSTAATVASGGTVPVDQTATGRSAKAYIDAKLSQYGLSGLGSWAWQEYLNRGEGSEDSILLDMQDRPEYQARFPAMAALRKSGNAMSEADYIKSEQFYASKAREYGLPEEMYNDPGDFAKLIEGNVGGTEWEDRLKMAQTTALQSPEGEAMRQFLSKEYGVPNAVGLVTAYWIDPTKGEDIIKKQFAAAQVAADAAVTGFGSLTKDQAERVGSLGLDNGQMKQTFTSLAGLHELQQAQIGDRGSQAIDQGTMIDAALAGDAAAQEKLQKEQRRRATQGSGGGQFAGSQKGLTGLGSASS